VLLVGADLRVECVDAAGEHAQHVSSGAADIADSGVGQLGAATDEGGQAKAGQGLTQCWLGAG
jgi:hypothetical protein